MKKLLTLTLLTIGLSGNALAEGVAYDPYEGYNRFMFGVNDHIDRHFSFSRGTRLPRRYPPPSAQRHRQLFQ